MKKQIILDARYCVDGVWRCDLVPADHREESSDRRPGDWSWLDQEELEKLLQQELMNEAERFRFLSGVWGFGTIRGKGPFYTTGT